MNDMLNAEAGNMEQLLADNSIESAEIEARPIDAQAQTRNTVVNGLSTDAEEEDRERERCSKREMCFVRESVLRRLNRIPRKRNNKGFCCFKNIHSLIPRRKRNNKGFSELWTCVLMCRFPTACAHQISPEWQWRLCDLFPFKSFYGPSY